MHLKADANIIVSAGSTTQTYVGKAGINRVSMPLQVGSGIRVQVVRPAINRFCPFFGSYDILSCGVIRFAVVLPSSTSLRRSHSQIGPSRSIIVSLLSDGSMNSPPDRNVTIDYLIWQS